MEDYLDQDPKLADDEEVVIELLYLEYVEREDLGKPACDEEMYARFPRYRERMTRLFELHRFVRSQVSDHGAEPRADEPVSGHVARGDDAVFVRQGFPRIGSFEVLEELGRGGMGVVYKARQLALDRTVAIKRISADWSADPQLRARMRFEAEAVARLHHPNIVQVYEFVDEDDFPYIVLEYVEGVDLSRFSKDSERRINWAAQLIETLALAIDHAHRRGVIHRDLTPANVLIGLDGSPKISDFGLAKFLDRQKSITASGLLIGTPRYMAPEQISGRASDVGPAADLYALGAILYELLTGEVPFRCETPLETICKVIEDSPEPPSRRWSDVPADLETICLKCLEREPGRRYLTAAELAEDLRRFRVGEPIRARPTSPGRRLLKWARRRPAEAGLVALVALVVVVILVVGSWSQAWLLRHNRELENVLDRERRQAAAVRVEQARAELQETVARRHRYGSQIKLAQQAWEAGQVDLAQELLANDLLEPRSWNLQGFEWTYLHRLCHRRYSLFWGHESTLTSLTVSHDGRTVASCGYDGTVLLHDLASGRVIAAMGAPLRSMMSSAHGDEDRIRSPGRGKAPQVKLRGVLSGQEWSAPRGDIGLVYLLGFAPDDETLNLWDNTIHSDPDQKAATSRDAKFRGELAAQSDPSRVIAPLAYTVAGGLVAAADNAGRVTIREVATGRTRLELETGTWPIHALAFSLAGDRLSAALGQAGAIVWETRSGQILQRVTDHIGGVAYVRLSPDGTILATCEEGRNVVFREVATDRKWSIAAETAGEVLAIEFSPDGRSLVIAGRAIRSRICDVATGTDRAIFDSVSGNLHAVAFTPDGQSVLLGGEDPRIRLWRLAPVPDPPPLAGHDHEVWSLAFSPDGRTLASGSDDQTIAVWDMETRRRRATLTGHEATVSALAVSPDGRILASGELSRFVKLWDIAEGREIATLVGHTGHIRALAFAPDGQTLATAGNDLKIRLWDVGSRTCRATLEGHVDVIKALDFSPDGRILASGGNDQRVVLHPLQSGHAQQVWITPANVTSLAFSPDGRRLALGDEARGVTIWDVAAGQPEVALRGHTLQVLALAFSPDGNTLASSGEDRTVRLWDPVTGQERLILRGHDSRVNAVVFSPDGQTLATASHDGEIRLWDSVSER